MKLSVENKDRDLILDCLNKIGEEVSVSGWVITIRKHGKIAFLDLRDRSGVIQVGFFDPTLIEKVALLRSQDVVTISGLVKKREERYINSTLPTGTIELEAKSLDIVSQAVEMPFDMGGKDLNLELPTLLDHRALTLRHPKVLAIFKVQETIIKSFRKTLEKKDFTEIFVPTIVPTATEGGAEVFQIQYYDHKAYLGQSPQMYKQIMVSIFERVYTIAHAYRAEPSVTTRHLSEYISLDAEMGFISSFDEIMDMAEKVIKDMFLEVSQRNKTELDLFGVQLPILENKFPRIKMRDAQEILFKRTERDHRKEPDLDPSDEKEICKWAIEEHGVPFVFITHYPTKKRPFYTMPDPKDPEYTLGFDLVGINEEWVTGGQRIHDYEMLLENTKKWGNKPEHFEIYLQAFKYGMPPEGGFAMGAERITKDILGLQNVREASLFPRDMERVDELFSKHEEKDQR